MEEKIRQSKVLKIIDVAAVIIISFLANTIVTFATVIGYSITYGARGGNLTNPNEIINGMYQDPSILMFSSTYNLLAIVIVFLFWKFADKQDIKRLGFSLTEKTGIQLLCGILAAILAVGVIILFGSLFGIIDFQGMGTREYGVSQIIVAMLIGLLTFLMVGFGEEAVYRSYVQNHMLDMMGKRYGLVVSALVFTAIHLMTYGKVLDLIDVFLAGLLLGYAFILTKSIYLPAAFHFMWDYLQISFFRLQHYDYYQGPVLFIFNNSGDLLINNYNLGNKLEVVFIIVEIMLLILIHTYRAKISRLATKQ